MAWPDDIPTLTAALKDGEIGPAEWDEILTLLYGIPPVLGTGVKAAFASLAARLAAMQAQLDAQGTTGLVNLRVTNDATSPNSKLVITADTIAIGGTVVNNVSVVADIAVDGKNGFDNLGADAEDALTWYSAYIGLRPDTGELCGLLSKSATTPITTHASLNALFTKFRRVARVYNDGSSNFRRFRKDDHWVKYEHGQVFTHASNAAATDAADNTASSCTTVYPPGTKLARLFCAVAPQSPGAIVLSVRRKGTPADTYVPVISVPDGDVSGVVTQYGRCEVGLDANREFEWSADVTPNANLTAGIYIGPAGYYDPS